MKDIIYSRKYPKQEQNPYIQEDFTELINRKTENEHWIELFDGKYEYRLLNIDDRTHLRKEYIKACVEFAKTKETDIVIRKDTECVYVNLSFDGLVDFTELKDAIGFADHAILVSGIDGKSITLSLIYQLYKITFFKKKTQS